MSFSVGKGEKMRYSVGESGFRVVIGPRTGKAVLGLEAFFIYFNFLGYM